MQDWEPPNKEYPPPKAGEPELFRAARVGDHDTIRKLIAAGADVNATFDVGLDPGAYADDVTPLWVAAGSGDGATVETVQLLLDLGARLEVEACHDTVAGRACAGLGWNYRPGGDSARLELLLKLGSPVGRSVKSTARAVADVAGEGDAARLAVLLRHGAPANAVWDAEEAKRDAARDRASMASFREAQPLGLSSVMDSMPDEFRESFEQTMREMEDKREVEQASAPWSFEIPLFRAVESGSVECVRMLLQAGADPLTRDNSRRTALFGAASVDVARELVKRGLSLEDRDHLGWSPLDNAVSDGAAERVKALIEAGANVNSSRDRGYTVFMSAVGSGRNLEVLQTLVRAGADVNAVSELGYNAFHAAIDVNGESNAEESVREAFEFLLRHGVSIEHRNSRGQTPLARAIDEGTGVEVCVLCELGANPNAPSTFHRCGEEGCGIVDEAPLAAASRAAVDSDVKTEALLKAGADPLWTNPEGHNAMHLAVSKLCSETPDLTEAWGRFWSGLKALQCPESLSGIDRETHVARVRPVMREFIRAFSKGIPIGTQFEYEAGWREDLLNVIEVLAAYGSYAWHQRGPKAD